MSLRAARRPIRAFNLWRAISWLLIVVVVILSLMPQPIDIPVAEGDKWGHATAYALLMLWFVQMYTRPVHWRLAIGMLALGILMECAQGLTAYRHFDYYDMLANGSGVFLGWLLGGTALGLILQRVVGKTPEYQ